mmetsp:Transcript_24932/g.53118  ORF Transcript_24932/g.53118 Transcript_24932/m.53118 type:complete len:229 (-) Transcript_24932:2316-3002(-)
MLPHFAFLLLLLRPQEQGLRLLRQLPQPDQPLDPLGIDPQLCHARTKLPMVQVQLELHLLPVAHPARHRPPRLPAPKRLLCPLHRRYELLHGRGVLVRHGLHDTSLPRVPDLGRGAGGVRVVELLKRTEDGGHERAGLRGRGAVRHAVRRGDPLHRREGGAAPRVEIVNDELVPRVGHQRRDAEGGFHQNLAGQGPHLIELRGRVARAPPALLVWGTDGRSDGVEVVV